MILHGWMKSIHGVLFHVSFLRGVKIIVTFFIISGNLKKDTLRLVSKITHISKLDAYTIIIFSIGKIVRVKYGYNFNRSVKFDEISLLHV